MSRISRGIKFWDHGGGLLHWQFKFSYSLDGILCWFLVLILNFVWKAAEVEAESIALLIFVLWRQFNCRRVRGGEVGQKVLFKAS